MSQLDHSDLKFLNILKNYLADMTEDVEEGGRESMAILLQIIGNLELDLFGDGLSESKSEGASKSTTLPPPLLTLKLSLLATSLHHLDLQR